MKKKFSNYLTVAVSGLSLLLFGATATSCDDTDEGTNGSGYSIELDKSDEFIARGRTLTITPTFTGQGASDFQYTWVSSNTAVARVSRNFDNSVTVTGVGEGETTIKIISNSRKDLMASCELEVFAYGIELDHAEEQLLKGQTFVITPTFSEEAAKDYTYTWTSSDTDIVTVTPGANNTVTVTGVEAGTASITIAAVEDPSLVGVCEVEVVVYEITLDKTAETVARGQTFVVTPTFNYEAAAALAYTWTSSDPSVATVAKGADNTVTVTAVKPGNATIKITSDLYPEVTASCELEVINYSVTLDKTATTIGKERQIVITPTFHGTGADQLAYTWTTSDASVATVVKGANNIATVTGVGAGTARIKITCDTDAEVTATCDLTVVEYSITLDKVTATVGEEQTLTITPTFNGENAAALDYTWTSSAAGTATVTKGANNVATVTGVAIGSATITITCDDQPTLTASCAVEVVEKVITFNPESDKIYVEGTAAAARTEVTQTLENPNVYAWYGDLGTGKLSIPVVGDATNYMVPADGVAAFASSTADAVEGSRISRFNVEWDIPAAGKYRVVIDIENNTMAVYSPAIDLQPVSVEWTHPQNGPTTTVVTTLWYYGNNRWNWGSNTEGEFTQSLADPQVFVYNGSALNGRTKFGVAQHNNCYVYTGSNSGEGVPAVVFGEANAVTGGSTTERNFYFNLASGTKFIIVDVRNMTMVSYAAKP